MDGPGAAAVTVPRVIVLIPARDSGRQKPYTTKLSVSSVTTCNASGPSPAATMRAGPSSDAYVLPGQPAFHLRTPKS
jgi:hypothetical protein